MKLFNYKLFTFCIFLGLALMFSGFLMGAKRNMYIDADGIHVYSNSTRRDYNTLQTSDTKFTNIDIDAHFADVDFIISDTYRAELSHLDENANPQCEIINDTLVIRDNTSHSRNGFRLFDLNLERSSWNNDKTNKISVYLPKDTELDKVNIKTDLGKINVSNFKANITEIESSFGKVNLNNIETSRLYIDLDSGGFNGDNIISKDVEYSNSFGSNHFYNVEFVRATIESDSGEIKINEGVFDDIEVRSDFGAVTMKDVVAKDTVVEANSGAIDLAGDFRGSTEIDADFGSVDFKTRRAMDYYSLELDTDFGSINLDGENVEKSFVRNTGRNLLKITTDSGSIKTAFLKR